jgi:deoxyribonuclease II
MRLFWRFGLAPLLVIAAAVDCAESTSAQPSAPANTGSVTPGLLSSLGDDGQPVDWWFMYKLPMGVAASVPGTKNAPKSRGDEYLYFDNRSASLAQSRLTVADPASALQQTLQQLAGNPGNAFGCVFYNDELPEGFGNDSSTFGHCKGVLAFDMRTDSAFWMMHSDPRFGAPGQSTFPTLDFGQTFLCITLKDAATAANIASQMLTQQGPQTYGAILPAGVIDVWQKLAQRQFTLSTTPGDLSFESRAGAKFRCFAKSRVWNGVLGPDGRTFDRDLWSDLVGPSLHADLGVESWLRGPSFGDTDPGGLTTTNVTSVDLTPLGVNFAWPETKDHAKWAVSFKNEGNWVCISDINREVTQGKRGGAAICFQNDRLWTSLSQIEKFGPRPQLKRAVHEMGSRTKSRLVGQDDRLACFPALPPRSSLTFVSPFDHDCSCRDPVTCEWISSHARRGIVPAGARGRLWSCAGQPADDGL